MPRKQAIHGNYYTHILKQPVPEHGVWSLCGISLSYQMYWQAKPAKYSTKTCPRTVTCKSCIRSMKLRGHYPKENNNVQA